MSRSQVALALALTLVTIVSPARAHWGSLGRHLACGWSDGYHAANLCAPKAQVWSPNGWMSPLQAEPLPHPGAAAQYRQPAGPSLFRQPGAGSSVIVTDGPAIGP